MSLTQVAAAQDLALRYAAPTEPERLDLDDAAGRILATELVATIELPSRDVSIMDGYACALSTVRRALATVVGESAAGRPWPGTLDDGAAVRISTGAVVPTGAELVVAQEDTTRDGDRLVVAADVAATTSIGRHVRAAGSDVRRGEVLLPRGHHLGPAELALLAAAAVATVSVHRRPRVAIVSTGDELVAVGETPPPGSIVDTNAPMLARLCNDAGADVVSRAHCGDDPVALRRALDHAIAIADVVITSGGASVGDHDHVHAEAQREEFRILAWGVAMRPGKPTGVVRTPTGLWFALPGNPASSFVAYELFVRPVLRRMLGVAGDPRRPLRRMTAAAAFAGERTREHWVRARIQGDTALPLPDQLSGNLRSLAGADALVRVPIGCTTLAPGEPCDVLVLDPNAHERGP